jgi:hypothetical protein
VLNVGSETVLNAITAHLAAVGDNPDHFAWGSVDENPRHGLATRDAAMDFDRIASTEGNLRWIPHDRFPLNSSETDGPQAVGACAPAWNGASVSEGAEASEAAIVALPSLADLGLDEAGGSFANMAATGASHWPDASIAHDDFHSWFSATFVEFKFGGFESHHLFF